MPPMEMALIWLKSRGEDRLYWNWSGGIFPKGVAGILKGSTFQRDGDITGLNLQNGEGAGELGQTTDYWISPK